MNNIIKPKLFTGFGKDVKGLQTAEDCIKKAELDFSVGKASLFASITTKEIPNPALGISDEKLDELGMIHVNNHIEVNKKFATYREDTNQIFGVVGSKYHVIQNKDAFSFFDSLVDKGEAIYNNAGFMGIGETIFISAKMPDYIEVGKDNIEKNLVITMSHDGTGSIKIFFTPIRIVCKNTLNVALRGAYNKISIRHTRSAKENLSNASKILNMSNKLTNELGLIFTTMSKKYIVDKDTSNYLADVFLTEEELKKKGNMNIASTYRNNIISSRKYNIIKDVNNYIKTHDTQLTPETEGTIYGLFQGITGYMQNVKDYSSEEAKVKSIYTGDMSKLAQKALDVSLSML